MSCAWQQLSQAVNFPASSGPYVSASGCNRVGSASQEPPVELLQSDQGDGPVDFEFPIEVERMVFELCNSSKDVLKEVQPRLDSTPLGVFPFEGPGLTLDLGLNLSGFNLADVRDVRVPLSEPASVPAAVPAKTRGPFSLQHVPLAAPPVDVVPMTAMAAPATLPYFATSASSTDRCGRCVPLEGGQPGHPGYIAGSYVRSTPVDSNCGVQADELQSCLSFRELVVKGCLELESILRGHKQYSYIGDLLSFCHAIREASWAASPEFDSPSEETRTLIIAFFRLVSCWLGLFGLFPCQQELGQGAGAAGAAAGHAFREWQQASRRVIAAILRRVPVLRDRLQGDHAAPPWRPSSASSTSRPSWPKPHAAGSSSASRAASRAAKQGCMKGWSAAGSEPSLRARKASPRGMWQADWADDPLVDMEEGKAHFRQGSPRARDTWKPAFGQNHPGMEGFGLNAETPAHSLPEPGARTPTAMARPALGRALSSAGNRKWGGGPSLRCVLDKVLDLDDLHDGAYMKPGCYDVPLRRSVPPEVPPPLDEPASHAVNPAPPLLVSESTWQAAKASAETLCRALHAMHCPDEPSAPSAPSPSPAPAPAPPATPEQTVPSISAVADDGHLEVQWALPAEAVLSTTLTADTLTDIPADSPTPTRGKGSVSDRESKGRRARQRAGQGGGHLAGRSRSWTRTTSSQPVTQAAPRPQLSPAAARKAKAILEVLWNLQEAEDVKFSSPDGAEGGPGPGCVSLDSMARKLKRRAYESLEQFEQDFRRALFNHTKCSGESAKVCAQRTKSLEKAFNDLLQNVECETVVAATARVAAPASAPEPEEVAGCAV